MVSIQQVTHNRSAFCLPLAALAALSLLTGCQSLFGGKPKEPAAAPVARTAEPVAAPHEDNAIEVALANAPAEGSAVETTAPTSTVVINPSAPLNYTVKPGDTLWDISAMYLRDPWLWPEIWHVNPAVRNPHLIYPGDVLALAYGADGSPQVTVARGSALRVQPLIRSTALEGPIATIPYSAIAAFLGKPSIVSKDDVRKAPHVVALRDDHVVAGIGQDIYVKGLKEKGPGRYSVVEIGEELKDPESGKVLGYMGIYTGAARVDAVDKVSKGQLIESVRETSAGDLLYAADTQTASDIIPHAPPAGVKGQIMAVVDGVALIGQYQVVAVNRGSKHGLETGHVLAIDQKGEVIVDKSCKRSEFSWCLGDKVRLPDERAGTLLVFKTYETMSYGLIVNTTVPVRVADRVRTP